MADLIGRDFTPPDLHAKVTGRAKYAEDFRADGMLFCRLLTSPMPHARVVSIDASEALAMDGVVAILTADELPEVDAPGNTGLTNEPLYVGAPILAVAATDETTAQNAMAAISAATGACSRGPSRRSPTAVIRASRVRAASPSRQISAAISLFRSRGSKVAWMKRLPLGMAMPKPVSVKLHPTPKITSAACRN